MLISWVVEEVLLAMPLCGLCPRTINGAALANEVSISSEAGLRVYDGGSGRGQRVALAVGLLPVLLHLMNACMHVQFCYSFEKAAKSGAQDYQLGCAPLRVLLAEEAEMEGVPPMHLSAALALNLGFTMVQKYSIGTAI